jgi:hypothetical protein
MASKEEQILLAASSERQRTVLSRNISNGEGSKRLGAPAAFPEGGKPRAWDREEPRRFGRRQ